MSDAIETGSSYRLYSISDGTGRLQTPGLDFCAATEQEARDVAFAASAIGTAELWRGKIIVATYRRRKPNSSFTSPAHGPAASH
jgi:hypothetical protein